MNITQSSKSINSRLLLKIMDYIDKRIACMIVAYLKDSIQQGKVPADQIESLEGKFFTFLSSFLLTIRHYGFHRILVAIQCILETFQVKNVGVDISLRDLLNTQKTSTTTATATPMDGDHYKDEGNKLVQQGKYQEAVEMYTKAITYDERNAIYYANR
jgi:tetratricopeptide (TPR) repeat protein